MWIDMIAKLESHTTALAAVHPPVAAAHDLLHGWSGLEFAYALMTGSIIVGLIVARARWTHYFGALVLGVAGLLVAGIATAIIGYFLPPVLRTPVGIALFICFGYSMGRNIEPLEKFKWQRGARLQSGENSRSTRAQRSKVILTLAGVAIPPGDETKHFKLIGTTGTGKSTAIRELVTGALHRGDRAVIADPDFGYVRRFYDAKRGDVILNPFDPRSLKWDLFAEIKHLYDFEQMARSMIPEAGEDRTWQHYAQTFLAAVLRQAKGSGVQDTTELYRILTSAPMEELRLLLEGTPAQPFAAAGNEKMFGSIRSVTLSAIASLNYINSQTSAPFSIRRWIQEGRGVLFLPYRAGEIAALRSMISTWMRIAIFDAMGLPEGDARLWFIVDELDALGPIDGLKDALARLRKFGGRCVLGFQSIAQVSGTYGRGEAETLVENCGNTLILRCSASEGGGTARFASKLIGEREIIRENVSRTHRPNEWLATKTRSEQYITEPAVLASEIEQLPDLCGYLKLASGAEWKTVSLAAPV
jgi:type IV secretory pathway TraG/TraD family ATPase VirD4